MKPLLQIKNLSVTFLQGKEKTGAVKNISFDIDAGKITAIVGESGSGKSVTALALLKLLPKETQITGEILFENGQTQNLSGLDRKGLEQIRGSKISMIFQEPMTSLNPVISCGKQVMESILLHQKISTQEAKKKTIALFEKVQLPFPEKMYTRYPHEISGGQKQRVMIAMAMCCNPAILIADEPTTALDVTVQKNILGLIKELQLQNNMAVIFITHDLGLVADVADRVIVMQKGEIVEQGDTKAVLLHPQQAYTKALLACRPANNPKNKRLPVVSDFLNIATGEIKEWKNLPEQSISDKILLEVKNLSVHYRTPKKLFSRAVEPFKAVDDVSFNIKKGETAGLVGESGCGKTTLGRAVLQLIKPTSGKILLNGTDIASKTAHQMRMARQDLQIVFQDPYGSLNPRITIGDAILEPLKVHSRLQNDRQRKEWVHALLEKVSLQTDHYHRYPHQFSGGQRQRICIARALALNPSFIVFDESVSALDVSVQAQVLNLINDLKKEFQFTSLFISHDLSVVHYICDRIMVMQQGKIVETGNATEVYHNPQHPYTQKLMESVPGKKLMYGHS